jgi:hypothetical protein
MQCVYVVCLGGIVGDTQLKYGSNVLYIVYLECNKFRLNTLYKHITWPTVITLEFCREHIQIRYKKIFQKSETQIVFQSYLIQITSIMDTKKLYWLSDNYKRPLLNNRHKFYQLLVKKHYFYKQ